MGGDVDQLQPILERLGDFGCYQKFQHFLHLLTWLTAGVHIMSFVFVFPMLDHRCFVEELDGPFANSSSSELLLESFIPANSSCSMYENGTDSEIIPCPRGYVYSSPYFKSSRVTEWDMVCEREWMRALLQSLLLFGALVGAFLSGLLADKYGRKVVVCGCGFVQLFFGLSSILITNYTLIAIIMFGYGLFGAAGSVVPAVTLSMEIIGPTRRAFCGTLFDLATSTGFMLDCLWAWLLPQRVELLQLIFALHSLLLFGHWWWMDESICWCWAVGQREKALQIAKKAAIWNGVNLDDFEMVPTTPPESRPSLETNVKTYGILDLFKYPEIRRRSLLMAYTWFTGAVIYFGLTYNSINLSGNPYLAFILNILAEFPGSLLVIFLAPKLGSKLILSSSLLSSGLACIFLPMLPKDLVNTTLVLTMVAKVLATVTFNMVNGCTAELFPTVVRNTAMGLCVMGSRTGSTIVPELNLLKNAAPGAPSMSFGTFGVLASLFVIFLMPETRNKSIPQSIEEVEQQVVEGSAQDEEQQRTRSNAGIPKG